MKKLCIIGNVVKDAKVQASENKTVLLFTVAVNNSYTDKEGNRVEKADFINCFHSVYSNSKKDAKLGELLKKGVKIYAEGYFDVKHFVKADGEIIIDMKVNATMIEIVKWAKNENNKNVDADTYAANLLGS